MVQRNHNNYQKLCYIFSLKISTRFACKVLLLNVVDITILFLRKDELIYSVYQCIDDNIHECLFCVRHDNTFDNSTEPHTGVTLIIAGYKSIN